MGRSVTGTLSHEERQKVANKVYNIAVSRGYGGRITRREAYRIVAAADDTNTPIWRLAALVEKESGFEHNFGHDYGSILHGLRVTKERYQQLLRHIRRGGTSNGVSYVQATYPAFLLGNLSLWRPKVNLRWGARLLDDLIKQYGSRGVGQNRYNGDPTGQYGIALYALEREWARRLGG